MIPRARAEEAGLTVTADALLALRRHLRPPFEGAWHPDQRPVGFPGRRRGAGIEVVDVRAFSEGDDVRHLDRHVTARTGVPHVRTYREERGATVLLVADFRRPMLWGTRRALRSVAAAEALAIGGWRAVEAGSRVGLYAFGGGDARYVAARGRVMGMAAVAGGLAAAHDRALAAVASAARPPEPMLDEALEAVTRLASTGSTIVLASALDDEGPEFSRLAAALGRAGRLRIALVRDAFETAPPVGSYPYADAGGRRHWSVVGPRAKGPDARRDGLERLGVAVLPIDAGEGAEVMGRAWSWFDGPGR